MTRSGRHHKAQNTATEAMGAGHTGNAPNPTGDRLSFIGSFPEDADQAVIVLRGPIDPGTVDRLADHVEDLLGIRTRFLAIDATAVDSYDERLLELLGRSQHRLEARRGLLTVHGLHPSLLDARTPLPPPAADPASAAEPPRPTTTPAP